jgi:hypothetical protein
VAAKKNTRGANAFLGSKDFQGKWLIDTGPVTVGGQSTFTGLLSFTNVPRDLVARELPNGYELAPRRTGGQADKHPVLLCFGDHGDGVLKGIPGFPDKTGYHYSEVIAAAPFVRRRGQPGWFTFVLRMYLDSHLAVSLGNRVFGYRKQKGTLLWTGDQAEVWAKPKGAKEEKKYLEGELVWGAGWYDGNAALERIPNFAEMQKIMSTRVLGWKTGARKLVISRFEWNVSRAKVATAKTSYRMVRPFQTSMSAWPNLSPFENARDGAVVVRGVLWRLGGKVIDEFEVPRR